MKNAQIWKMWWDMASAANAAAVTIGVRAVTIPIGMMTGDARATAESQRMVNEKLAAINDGYLAVWRTLPKMAAATLHPENLLSEAFRAGFVFSQPGMRKAEANAKRLTGRRKKRK